LVAQLMAAFEVAPTDKAFLAVDGAMTLLT
jgi:hypothetical protein